MAERYVLRDGILNDEDAAKREIFLRFHYADKKDAFKQMFAVIAGVFVFSATFGQRVIPSATDDLLCKLYFFSPFALFSLSLILCLVGYYMLGVAGDKATNLKLWRYWLKSWDEMHYHRCAVHSSTALEVSGGVFILGLFMLARIALF